MSWRKRLPLPRRELDDHPRARKREDQRRKIFDWLSNPDIDNLSPWQRSVIDLDWTKSPLGPISSWPLQLRQMVLIVMADPTPAVVYWGDNNIIVYNEAYTELIGEKHPSLQGQDPKVGFKELWSYFEDLLAKQRDSGMAVTEENMPVTIFRHGYLEECYFTWKFVPIIGPDGWMVGSLATVFEVTSEVIAKRRLSTINYISHQISESGTVKDILNGIIEGLMGCDNDAPLVLLYSVADSKEALKSITPPRRSMSEPIVCVLEGSIGVDQEHELVLSRFVLSDQTWLSPHFEKALDQLSSVVFPVEGKTKDLMEGLEWRGVGEPSSTMVVYPIIPTNSGTVLAFSVIGLNPRRPYDGDYQRFLRMLTEQATTSQLTSIILGIEVERRAQLSQQYAAARDKLSKELTESESKFLRFVSRAPFGLGILTASGRALYANDLWKEYTQLAIGSTKVDWDDVLCDGESKLVNEAWLCVVNTKKARTIYTRIKKRLWQAPDLDSSGNAQFTETFLLLSMYPDEDDINGEVTTVMSCITDISELKWSESQLRRKMDQAIELKEQQEKFIDMTSHEMRNPLSALIGCADEIISSLNAYRTSLRARGTKSQNNINSYNDISGVLTPDHLLDEAIEAADTIIYCSMHQKRIIDDILTLSRLDSDLLQVSPEPSEPIQIVRNALKMFESETKRAGIEIDLVEQESVRKLNVDWTLLDPSRVLQVFINLMTNAIKFTRTETTRHIKIVVGASLTRPSESNGNGVHFIPRSKKYPDQTTKAAWGDGELIYFSITVQDTGRGLSSSETQRLFHIFQQASPKTYTQYGGSGLGLFISRQLVEMQGGEIGVASEDGKGSTFQFYVKTRRSLPKAGSSETPDFQLLAREDAVREACRDETTPDYVRPKTKRSMSLGNGLIDSQHSLHILVVEDNLVNQKVVAKQLRKEGHAVSVADHGEEALDFIRKTTFWHTTVDKVLSGRLMNVVLMDLEMPVMDGITCVKKIRELQREGKITDHIPVVAVTANAREDQITRALNAGMDGVVTKPYRINDMIRQIQKVVAKCSTNGSVKSTTLTALD